MTSIGFGAALAVGRARPVERPGFAFDGAAPPAGATLRRASAGCCHDAAGALTTMAADVPRIDHDPLTGAVRGLLIEEAATNALSWSDGTVAQLVSSSGVSDAPGTIPGFVNALRFGDNAVSRYAYKQYVPVVGETLTLSVVVRMDDGAPPAVGGTTSSGDFCMLVGGKVLDLPIVIEPAGGGAWRCAITVTASNTQSYWGVVRYTAQSARGFSATGMQLESGARATSYIATAAAAASRAADMLTLDWGAVGVADDPIVARYRFDDAGETLIATHVTDGIAAAPTPAAGRRLRRAERW